MTPEEKAAMRARISRATEQGDTLAREGVSLTRSPYFFGIQPRRFGRGADFLTSAFMSRAVAGVLVFVLVGGSGVAYAAEGSLPGETLYAVKIHVNERIEVALATTVDKKIAVETQIAERRVAEAQKLEAAGRLDATTTAEIEKNFDEHAARALALSGEDVLTIAMAVPTEAPVAPVADTSAAGATMQASEPVQEQEQESEQEDTAPRATMMLKTAVVTLEATSSEVAEMRDTERSSVTEVQETKSKKSGVRKVRESLEIQRNILKELKERTQRNENRRGQSGRGDSSDNR